MLKIPYGPSITYPRFRILEDMLDVSILGEMTLLYSQG